ncbi:MAG TPA: DUF559 domain-containing protein [Beijerinckiaceae bacterium]|nr:DUF559 domain-containing protein [Beijerinckiaceae bacterium]
MVREARTFARRQRQHPTAAEDELWQRLRDRRFLGLKFKRQEPIGPYTVDFLRFERKLVIELDGRHHGEQKHYDTMRTKELENQGFFVIRFANAAVPGDIDAVFQTLKETLTPGPSPKLERGEF